MIINPRFIKTFIFALIALGLGAYIYFYEIVGGEKREKDEKNAKKFLIVKDKSIDKISFKYQGKEIVLECANDGKPCKEGENPKWKMTSPLSVAADSPNVNSFLSSLNALDYSEKIDAEKEKLNLADFKLEKPEAEVEIISGTEKNVIKIGDKAPLGVALYAQLNSPKTLYLIPFYFGENAKHDEFWWREKEIFSAKGDSVNSFSLFNGKENIKLSKKEGKWASEPPVSIDAEAVKMFLDGLNYLKVKKIISENKGETPKEFNGAKQIHTITLQTNDKVIDAKVFEKEKKYYITISDKAWLAEIDQGLIEKFKKDLNFFRDRTLLTAQERFKTKFFEVTFADSKKASFELKDKKWISKEIKDEINQAFLEKTLDKFVDGKILEFKNLETPKSKKEFAIILRDETGAVIKDFAVYAPEKVANENDAKLETPAQAKQKAEEKFKIVTPKELLILDTKFENLPKSEKEFIFIKSVSDGTNASTTKVEKK